MKIKRYMMLLSVPVLAVLSSCPAPLEPGTLSILQDTAPPVIIITSPEDYSEYSTVIVLSGSIEDPTILNAPEGSTCLVKYIIPGSSIKGSADIDMKDGTFSTLIDVSELEGSQIIEVSAVDLNGNEVSVTINLKKPFDGGDISNFKVVPDNKKVTVSWGDVPGAESYSLLEASFGMEMDDVTSPCVCDGLTNGVIYRFQLTAHMPEGSGDDAVSAMVEKMPLSERSLAPWIRETGFNSVTVEWYDNPNVDGYIVERSLSSEGPWGIHRNLKTSSFVDDELSQGETYFYRVKPADYCDITSDYIDGVAGNFEYELTGRIDTAGWARKVEVIDNVAYIADWTAGLAIIDVSDPANPDEPIYVETTDEVYDVDIYENYAYLAVNGSGIAVVEITDPKNPGVPSYFDTDSSAYGLTVSYDADFSGITNENLYVADSTAGLAVMDLSNPSTPGAPAYSYSGGYAKDVVVWDDYAYIADNSTGIAIIDVENPLLPGAPSYVDLVGNTTCISYYLKYPMQLYVLAEADENGLAIINMTSPSYPGEPFYVDMVESPSDIKTWGSTAYLAAGSKGLAIVNISDILTPSQPVYIDTIGYAAGVDVDGDFAYIADGDKGLSIIDLTNEPILRYPEGITISGYAYAVTISDQKLFIACGSDGIGVIDISDPENPGELENIPVEGSLHDIEVAGHYAYIADGDCGLAVTDITDFTTSPVYTNTIDFARAVTVAGNYAYVAVDTLGVAIIDISDPMCPGDPVYIDTEGDAMESCVSGNLLYVAADSGLSIIDISTPLRPVKMSYIDTEGSAEDIVVSDRYAYMAAGAAGLAVIDISDPYEPTIIKYADTDGSAYSLDICGRYAYIGDGTDGVTLIDIAEPENPVSIESGSCQGSVYDVVVSGDYAYIIYVRPIPYGDTGIGIMNLK